MSYAAGLTDFSPIGNLASDYYKGQQQRRQNELAQTFTNGLPRDQAGNVNYTRAGEMLAERGDVSQLVPLANADMQRKFLNGALNDSNASFPTGAQPGPQGTPQSGGYSARTAQAESGNSPTAENPNSSASGQYQFTNGTWIENFDKAFPHAAGLTPEQKLGVRDNPSQKAAQDKVFQTFTAGNESTLSSAGIPINDTTRYGAHFFGASDAAKVFKAPANTPLQGLVQPATLEANPFLQGKTAGDARVWLANKMPSEGGVAAGPSSAARPAIPPTGVPKGSPDGVPPAQTQSAPVQVAGPPTAGPGAPSPSVAAQPGAAPSPVAPPAQPQQAAMPPALRQIVPPQFSDPMQYVNFLRQKQASYEAAGLAGIKGADGAAKAYGSQADKVMDIIGKFYEQTPEQKNATASGGLNPLQFENAKIVAKVSAENSAQTPEQKLYEQARGQGYTGTEMQFQAERERLKSEAQAPYKIAEMSVREGGRPLAVHPNEVVTTGAQVNPALEGITNWAANRLGTPTSRPQEAPAGAPPAGSNTTQPPPGQSAFTPRLIKNPDGSVASSVTPSTEVLQKTAAANYEHAREAYAGAQQAKMQLASMEDSFRGLNSTNWSSTGAGAEAKLKFANAVNSVWQTLGVKGENLPFDPEKIADWQKLAKDTTRLGFSLARTLGAREAMQIVQGAINANPNIANTPLGAKMVLNAIRENAQRDTDYFEYATKYAQTHGGDLVGAEVEFNKLNKPETYARRAILQAQKDIPYEAIEQLRSDPSMAAAFDKHYNAKGAAKMFLGNTAK